MIDDQGAAIWTGAPSAPAPVREPLHLSWQPPPGMAALSFRIFFLRLVTLGIYGFWGRTEVRQRIWSAIRLNGEPLQYTGTGKELLLGFLVVLGGVMLPAFLVSFVAGLAFGPKSAAAAIIQLIVYVAFAFLLGYGMHRAQRYRLSRTRWRGIRGGLEGSSWEYARAFVWTGLVLVLSLGWAAPWRAVKLQGLITNGMRFGNRPFVFTANAGALYGRFAVLWFSGLVIVLLVFGAIGAAQYVTGGFDLRMPGRQPSQRAIMIMIGTIYLTLLVGFLLYSVVSAWYRAHMMNVFADHTTFEGARFRGSATGASLVALAVGNYLLLLFTLGLLGPVVQARSARYMAEHLALDGTVPVTDIQQRAADPTGRGEGLAQAFDFDAF